MAIRGHNLASLGIMDVVAAHGARNRLRAVHAAVSSTSLQGKAAILDALDGADDVLQNIERKCARRTLLLGSKGAFTRVQIPQELVEELAALAGPIESGEGAES